MPILEKGWVQQEQCHVTVGNGQISCALPYTWPLAQGLQRQGQQVPASRLARNVEVEQFGTVCRYPLQVPTKFNPTSCAIYSWFHISGVLCAGQVSINHEFAHSPTPFTYETSLNLFLRFSKTWLNAVAFGSPNALASPTHESSEHYILECCAFSRG